MKTNRKIPQSRAVSETIAVVCFDAQPLGKLQKP